MLRAVRELPSAAEDTSEELRGLVQWQVPVALGCGALQAVKPPVSSEAVHEAMDSGMDVENATEAPAGDRGEVDWFCRWPGFAARIGFALHA